ncbi:uncharacterized protein BP5553_08415 [Venustampulla echinocandica]|uniref:Saccharopine dehydrogenase [NAD(+), L-lysine-forming] n=1 Tax=Venustampulla echinocandica TaxID=2656787 RepID=A0A370TE72_9HELO|nr:uncharacterized protein BP5553_08415 [Venustampulla echinocandica]RDL32976.1 hypothetical protein BP5553_08415 [Venustampulla echinocandica]
MSTKHTILHLRSEQNPLEHRSALTPSTTKALICAGYEVHVERSPKDPSRKRIYDDDEFERVGAKLVDDQSWSKTPRDHIIIGLKLEPESFPLVNTHVQFAHCYKGQAGWQDVLSRFRRGGGTLLDLEFLQLADGSRVAEFAYYKALVGSAWAIKTWKWQLDHPGEQLPGVESFTQGRGYYLNEDEMLEQLRTDLRLGIKKAGRAPKVLVMGCLGRSGVGAVDLFLRAGLDNSQILKWDLAEVCMGGPFLDIVESDIFVNCAYLSSGSPFLDAHSLACPWRKLSVICDVSFDAANPDNLIPVYKVSTTSTSSTILVDVKGGPPLSVISIDHLSSLLPRESSEQLSITLLPYLLQLEDWKNNEVWSRAEKLFREKAATLPPDQVGASRRSISQRMEPQRLTDEFWAHHSFKDEERQRWDVDNLGEFDEFDQWERRLWEWERRWDVRLDEYGHWIYDDPDNKFAKAYFESTKLALSTAFETLENTYLCRACKDIFSFDRQFTLSELQDPNNNCQLCKLLCDCLLSRYDPKGDTFHLKRSGSFLKNTQDEKRILGLLSHPALPVNNNNIVQVGVPNLYSIASPFLGGGSPYFELLRQWLKDCDEHHGNCAVVQARCKPTRVLFVGNTDPNKVKLCEPTSPIDYIALSHCWGKPSDEDKKNYSTTSTNYKARLDEFPLNHLPKTFRDAVHVTRELGMKYLWIDSLCIIQGDNGDWEKESKQMQNIFASAYCTIAASSATSWDEGFLKRESGHNSIRIKDIYGQQISISDNIDDFENDVEKAQLNQRGWVVQERVLSRRIIHFTEKNSYWECGEGVRCENFAKLKCLSGRHHFLLDPRFPNRLRDSGYHRSVDFLQFLFQKYAKCGLTKKSDREDAIYSLMKHMETAFRTTYRYGTFRIFLHRLLLWHRSDEEIPGNVHKHYEDQLPSWTWMTYAGIAFPQIVHLKLADIQYDGKDALRVRVRSFRNCKVKKEERQYRILNDVSEKIGEVWFDETDSNFGHCVVVGMEDDAEADADKTYWILIIKRGKGFKGGSKSWFKRVGIGKVKALYVSKGGDDGRLM